ncbi:MAG: sigma-70 family RNA polymerase sigma factor [Planctomycetota bacterium]
MSDDRLSQIETLWSLVLQAHDGPATSADATQVLLDRYGPAVRRYLGGALRDTVAADDLYQDFAIRFLRGDFQSANPEKGRFRSFLKTILFRMVADYHRQRQKQRSVPMDENVVGDADDDDCDRQFTRVWRDEILKRAWSEIASVEKETGKPWYSVMRLRVENPKMGSQQLAERLSEQLGRPISNSNMRVILHRARDQFAVSLINAIADSLASGSLDEIEEELADLELLEYCQQALSDRRAQLSQQEPPAVE